MQMRFQQAAHSYTQQSYLDCARELTNLLIIDPEHGQAAHLLGILFADGLGVQQDSNRALDLFKVAADADIPEAMKYLGLMYLYGDGVAQDSTMAMNFFQDAVALQALQQAA